MKQIDPNDELNELPYAAEDTENDGFDLERELSRIEYLEER